MDQHPIPQDVTGFQFKLVGAMTVKQFGYVASGVIMAVVLYYLPLHSAFGVLFKVICVPLFGASGIVIAFVPIDGRPVDVMTSNFVKALFSPNQYIYHRQGRKLSFEGITVAKVQTPKKSQQKSNTTASTHTDTKQLDRKEEKLRALLFNSQGQKKSTIDEKETAFLQSLTIPQATPDEATPTRTTVQQTPPPVGTPQQKFLFPADKPAINSQPAMPTPPKQDNRSNENKQAELTKKESELEQALTQAKKEESVSKTSADHTVAEQKITVLSKQIQDVHAQKQQLENELTVLQKQLATHKAAPSVPVAPPAKTIQDPQHVRVIPQSITKKAGLPHVSDSPNVVVGIVKDPRGNILPNILVEVKDKDGNPVRAFKTNQLGQFASATPLSTGEYTIELEDPKKQQRFDVIRISANNQILPPIEIISHDAREELRKQLFSN